MHLHFRSKATTDFSARTKDTVSTAYAHHPAPRAGICQIRPGNVMAKHLLGNLMYPTSAIPCTLENCISSSALPLSLRYGRPSRL